MSTHEWRRRPPPFWWRPEQADMTTEEAERDQTYWILLMSWDTWARISGVLSRVEYADA